MRLVIPIVFVAATVYGGYWFAGRAAFDHGAVAAIEAAAAQGIDITYGDLTTRGFPSRFDTTLSDLSVAAPAYGFAWQAPFLQLLMLSYQPTRAIVIWPEQQTMTLADQTLTLTATRLRASASVEPSTTLPLRAVTLEGGPVRLTSDAGWWVAAENLLTAIRPDPAVGDASAYDVYASASVLAPPEAWRHAADPQGTLPAAIGKATLSAIVTTDAPLDRLALTDSAPSIASVRFTDSEVVWGSVHLKVNGTLSPDALGYAEGTLMLEVSDWDHLVAMAAAAGVIADETVPAWQDAFARLAGEADTITAPLSFGGGWISFGFLTLAPAPRLR